MRAADRGFGAGGCGHCSRLLSERGVDARLRPNCQASISSLGRRHPLPPQACLGGGAGGSGGLRINPGNIGGASRVREVVKAAKDAAVRFASVSMRVLWSATCLQNTESLVRRRWSRAPCCKVVLLEDCDFDAFKISVKASDVRLAIASYRLLASSCDHPLHLGITEAGGQMAGSVKSAIGLGTLLLEGIGDTLRVSLSADPVEEVRVGFAVLQSLKLRSRGVNIVACPSCSRQRFDVIGVVREAEERLEHIREPITVSIIGCVVNGPGEARSSDVGVAGGREGDASNLCGGGGEGSSLRGRERQHGRGQRYRQGQG